MLRIVMPVFESDPYSASITTMWIKAALENGGPELLKHPDTLPALNNFLASIEPRLGGREVLCTMNECVGKWRYIQEMAAVRNDTVAAAAQKQLPTSGAAKEEEADCSDDDDSETLDDVAE